MSHFNQIQKKTAQRAVLNKILMLIENTGLPTHQYSFDQ